MPKKKKFTQPEVYVEEGPQYQETSAVESPRGMTRRIGDLLGFLDFAFPGAAEMNFDEEDPTTFAVIVNNILPESVDQLVVPKLLGDAEKRRAVYSSKEKQLRIQFVFPAAVWAGMLPVFFAPIAHGRPEDITPTHVGALMSAIADGNVNGRDYQEWITKNMTAESSTS